MNAKFKYTKYGLILELIAASDNERVLVNEFMSTGQIDPKLKNMIVRPGQTDSSMEVVRPVYISADLLQSIGFSGNISPLPTEPIYALVKSGKAYILVGSGFCTLYVYGENLTNSAPTINSVVKNTVGFSFNDPPINLDFSDAEFISDKINLAEQLDELLLKY